MNQQSLEGRVLFGVEWKGGWSWEDSGYEDGKSIMEIYVCKDGNFAGFSKDIGEGKIGPAIVTGKLLLGKIKFKKKYLELREDDSLIYEGEKVGDGIFKGYYSPIYAYEENKYDIKGKLKPLQYEFIIKQKFTLSQRLNKIGLKLKEYLPKLSSYKLARQSNV